MYNKEHGLPPTELLIAPEFPKNPTLEKVMDRIDTFLAQNNRERKPGQLWSYCGVTTEFAEYLLEQEENIEAHAIKVWLLHALANKKDPTPLAENEGYSPEHELSCFSHGICISKLPEGPYLIDPTFSQFVNPENNTIHDEDADGEFVDTEINVGDTFSHRLIERGYFPLKEPYITYYLQRTSDKSTHQKPTLDNNKEINMNSIRKYKDLIQPGFDDLAPRLAEETKVN